MNVDVPPPNDKTFKRLYSDYKLFESRIEASEDILIKLSDNNAAIEKAIQDMYHSNEKFRQEIKFDIARIKTDLEHELRAIKKQSGFQDSFLLKSKK